MLIHIDSSAIADAVDRESPSRARSLACIEHVLLAHEQGKHVVSLAIEDLRRLSGELVAAPRALATLRKVQGEWSQIAGLRKAMAWHLELGVGGSFDGREAPVEGGRTVVRAALHHFDDFERVGRAILFGEHLKDADLYTAMGRALLARRGWRVAIACEGRLGGGSTLAETFERAADDGRIVLAIADSDQRCPDGRIRETARALLRSAAGKPAFQRAVVLHVRAAENLLPLALYEEALAPHPTTPSIPERLQHLERAVAASLCAYTNLKHGVKLYQIGQMTLESPERTFWDQISRAAKRDQCTAMVECTNETECRCLVVEGLGERALARVVDWLKKQDPKHVARLLSIEKDPKLERLCEQIMCWCIAFYRRTP